MYCLSDGIVISFGRFDSRTSISDRENRKKCCFQKVKLLISKNAFTVGDPLLQNTDRYRKIDTSRDIRPRGLSAAHCASSILKYQFSAISSIQIIFAFLLHQRNDSIHTY
jgi:hypothetical protein